MPKNGDLKIDKDFNVYKWIGSNNSWRCNSLYAQMNRARIPYQGAWWFVEKLDNKNMHSKRRFNA